MRRCLCLSSLALLLLPSCGKDVVLSVDATLTCHSTDDALFYSYGPASYEGFGGKKLKAKDIEAIFEDLRKHATVEFNTATLDLKVYDKITTDYLWSESYRFTKRTGTPRPGYDYGYDFVKID